MRGEEGGKAPNATYGNLIFPGKNGKLIQASDEVPARSSVASYKDAEGEDREWVHRALPLLLLALHSVDRGERSRARDRGEESPGRGGSWSSVESWSRTWQMGQAVVLSWPGRSRESSMRRKEVAESCAAH